MSISGSEITGNDDCYFEGVIHVLCQYFPLFLSDFRDIRSIGYLTLILSSYVNKGSRKKKVHEIKFEDQLIIHSDDKRTHETAASG